MVALSAVCALSAQAGTLVLSNRDKIEAPLSAVDAKTVTIKLFGETIAIARGAVKKISVTPSDPIHGQVIPEPADKLSSREARKVANRMSATVGGVRAKAGRKAALSSEADKHAKTTCLRL